MNNEQAIELLENDIKIAGIWNVRMFVSTQEEISSFDGDLAEALMDGDLHELLNIPEEYEDGDLIIEHIYNSVDFRTLVALIQQPVKIYSDKDKTFYSSGWGYYKSKWVKGNSLEEIYTQALEEIK